MNKTAIKNYAVWARKELMERVIQKAYEYGVTKDSVPPMNSDAVDGKLLSNEEKSQLNELIIEVNKHGFEHVVEEVAYTWFNRFIALRFMEVNNYLPQRVRVFTNENNEFKPEILTEAIHIDLDGLDKQKIFEYINQNNQEDLYKYLLLTICNDMNQYLPDMFTSIKDYKTLLFPNNLLMEGSVLDRLVKDIDEDSWKDQVQIIGWLYQYYNSELKDAVMKKKNYSKDDIPAATQLFTPDWIVRYMVENSLGRIYVDKCKKDGVYADGRGPDEMTWHERESDRIATEKLIAEKMGWKYYLPEAEQTQEVCKQIDEIQAEYAKMDVKDIKIIDPCMGSGHILVYAFDVLMDIYRDVGYTDRDAAKLILENNLYGLEIDERAYHLAYFALMMKARSYNRRILSSETKVNVVEIREPEGVMKVEYEQYLGDQAHLAQYLLDSFQEAKEFGSIIQLNCTAEELDKLNDNLAYLKADIDSFDLVKQSEILGLCSLLRPLIKQAKLLVWKYDVVITNPPYMSPTPKQKPYVQKHYPDSKSDLFAVFIEKGLNLTENDGYSCLVTMQSWMFLSSYEKLRIKLLKENTLTTLMHMENMVMHIAFGTVVSCFKKHKIINFNGTYNYVKLSDLRCDTPKLFPNKQERFAQINTENFSKIPGSPIAYWLNNTTADMFQNKKISNYMDCKSGIMTGSEDFIKLWFEPSITNIKFDCASYLDMNDYKWFPLNSGGGFRKWYGNNSKIVNLFHGGEAIKKNVTNYRLRDPKLYFQLGITWGRITSSDIAFRNVNPGSLFGDAGPVGFISKHRNYALSFLNSCVVKYLLNALNPTLNFQVHDITNLPVVISKEDGVERLCDKNICISKFDWDSFETSWDFKVHPLVKNHVSTISEAYNLWSKECEERFNTLKSNEEELNRIFIDIYGLLDELDPYVEDKDVTVRKADLVREVKSFISYAVGCMFGRYSLDKEGLVFAGGNFDEIFWKYRGQAALNIDGSLPIGGGYAGISLAKLHYASLRDNSDFFKATKLKYEPDVDGIIPICDEQYFEDDIVSRFIEFVKVVYGSDTLEDNLQFISNVLGGKGNPRDVLRDYFLNEFFKDHCNTYQVTGSGKRPIYWLFESGKNNGFKALVYIHRYTPDLIARMRTGYIHPLQARYRTQMDLLQKQLEEATATSEKVKISKQLKKIKEQSQELARYEDVVHHWADKMEPMDLDDGVKANYAKFQELLAKIK